MNHSLRAALADPEMVKSIYGASLEVRVGTVRSRRGRF